jgi:methylase of polypeptide subunit release factors
MYPKKSVHTLVQEIAAQLASVYNDAALRTQYAWWTLQAITGQSHAKLLTHDGIALTGSQQAELARWIEQLVEHEEPIQYLLGSVPFAGLDLAVAHPILIPRPETEEWVMHIIDQLHAHNVIDAPLRILDLATGSGCIAVALAHALPNAQVHASFSYLTQIGTGQCIACGDKNIIIIPILRQRLYDLIANPPYIGFDEWKEPTSKSMGRCKCACRR